MDFCGPESHLRKIQYRIWNPHTISKSKRKKIESGQETEIMLYSKMPKSSCLKWTYGRPDIDNRVALLFTRYLTAIGIIPESLKSIGQFLTCRN